MDEKPAPAIPEQPYADEDWIRGMLGFIAERKDCADFRMVRILRLLCLRPPGIPAGTLAAMKEAALGFKYHMDEPGTDSMCFWSENHQLLFAACEYIAGQLYPEEEFSNSGMTGEQHRLKGKKAVVLWLRRRFELGMSEWHSNTYYEEDVAPLCLLIDFAGEPEVAEGAVILLDLILLDMALHQFQGFFCAASGRCYEDQKKDPRRQNVLEIMERAFGFGNKKEYTPSSLSAGFVGSRRYRLPRVLYEIAHWPEPLEIHDSMGMDLGEIGAFFRGRDAVADRGAYLWAMEAFTTPQSVNLTMDLFRRWKLRDNGFLRDLRVLDIPPLRHLGVLPPLVRLLNPVTRGIAIQRANTCTYRTRHSMLSTAQRYHPGTFGDQQHIWQATLPGAVTVFTTHPATACFDDSARNASPSYWVGNGIHPDAAQYRNACLCLYRLDVRRGLMERKRALFTHAYFPRDKFDEARRVRNRLWLGRKDGGYIALFGTEIMEERGSEELIQRGRVTGWAAVTGGADEYKSFADFASHMEKLDLIKTKKGIVLQGGDAALGFAECRLDYRGDFRVDGRIVDTDYPRLDCPFGRVARNPREYTIEAGPHRLRLRLDGRLREGALL